MSFQDYVNLNITRLTKPKTKKTQKKTLNDNKLFKSPAVLI